MELTSGDAGATMVASESMLISEYPLDRADVLNYVHAQLSKPRKGKSCSIELHPWQ